MTSLYRAFDKNGVLLYVGITGRGIKRLSEHARKAPWWAQCAQLRVEHFASVVTAKAAEAHAIEEEAPLYNGGLAIRPVHQPALVEPREGDPRPLTPATVASLFNVSVTTVENWANDGKLKHFRTLGGQRRFRQADVEALLGKPPSPGVVAK